MLNVGLQFVRLAVAFAISKAFGLSVSTVNRYLWTSDIVEDGCVVAVRNLEHYFC